ncbi:MAG TPA: hypothetical protein VIY48_16090 [Candidatus Paceibacterota bacterium]
MEKFYLFGVLCLAAWRLASLFANERGPFHVFLKIRRGAIWLERHSKLASSFHLFEGLTCEWCNSLWFGVLLWLGWNTFGDGFVKWMTPLAISTVVIIIKYIVQGLEQMNKSVVQSDETKAEVSPAPQTA